MENVNNSVVILGYKERVGLFNPDVSILKNGISIGKVERQGRCQLDIKEACELTFKMDNPVAQLIGRPTTCRVNPGDQILLSYNTFTGKLVAQLTDNNNLQQTIERNTKKEKKGRIVGIIVAIILAAVSFGIVLPLSLSPSSAYDSIKDNTTKSVYKGSRGSEIIICDNGIAYIDGKKGSWTDSYVRLGSNSYEFIKIRQNGMVSEGGIFEGKFYYGRDAETAIKENYPNGESLTKTRR